MTSAIEGDLLRALGMVPMQVQVNQIALAISDGSLDAASAAPPPLFEFGISRVTRYHYIAPLGAQTLTLLMSRKSFDGLPADAQAIIRKYSGDWMAKRHIEIFGADSSDKLERLKADPLRKVVYPTAAEIDAIDAVARSVTDTWLAQEPRHRLLFDKMQAELAKVRSGN
jgi:TRAP-type C4-dicarboxylate transport system substrate-binding protein